MLTKPEYHQSNLKHYLICPMRFKLSLEHRPEYSASAKQAMREGELFEGYVLGFKPEKDEKSLIGKKKPETIQRIKQQAEAANGVIQRGEAYKKIKAELEDYGLAGEVDFLGRLDWGYISDYLGQEVIPEGETINDLKFTGSIDRVWWEMQTAADHLQALEYQTIHYLNTGHLLPFVYLVFDSGYEQPALLVRKIITTQADVEWFLSFVDRVHNDLFYRPTPSRDACLGGKGRSRCPFLGYCKKGKAFLGGYEPREMTAMINREQG